jgi:hypothetical protein
MKYVLIQMPDSAIDIVDNNNSIGKSRVYRLIDEGGKPVGTLDSDLRPGALRAGFEHCESIRNDKLRDQIRLAREALDGDIKWEQVHPTKPEGGETL